MGIFMSSRNFAVGMSRQKGVVLIVGLIMVLLISIVALASIRGSGLQEAMSGNMRDRGLAFQVAEGGLADGENVVLNNDLLCDGAIYGGIRCLDDRDKTPANSVQYFNTANFTNFGNISVLNLGQNIPPSTYVVERIASFKAGKDDDLTEGVGTNISKVTAYRVTAIGNGISSDSQAIVQSTYNLPH